MVYLILLKIFLTYSKNIILIGRARASKAFYCVLVNDTDTEAYLNRMMEFHSIEQQVQNL